MRGDGGRQSAEPSFRSHSPLRVHGKKDGASFQIIILGSSGGPREDTVTGLLVRSSSTKWRKSSVIAVDAGAHLASMLRILEHHMPRHSDTIPEKGYQNVLKSGPFAGVEFPSISAKANALFIFRELLHSFLITHPHLDHLSGMGINTPALEFGREAKAIVALPSTIEAIKTHIFNDSIWPNLSDERHGVGFVTYRRLVEGGNSRLGYGDARGYVNVCDGLATKCWSVSHGRCRRHSHSHSISMSGGHQRADSLNCMSAASDGYGPPPPRRSPRALDEHGYLQALAMQHIREPSQGQVPATPSGTHSNFDGDHRFRAVDSSAFFIRNDESGQEILVFGDIEPDSLSLSPRNYIVWEDCASKIVNDKLHAIFIECSYDDSVQDSDLYGHLCPRHLTAELGFLAQRVMAIRRYSTVTLDEAPSPAAIKRKRKRNSPAPNGETPAATSTPKLKTSASPTPAQPVTERPGRNRRQISRSSTPTLHEGADLPDGRGGGGGAANTADSQAKIGEDEPPELSNTQQAHPQPHQPRPHPKDLPDPLAGVTVHIIHVKDSLADGPSPGDIILNQLKAHGAEAGLGCGYDVTSDGESIWV